MATFVTIEPDAFNSVKSNVVSDQGSKNDPDNKLASKQYYERNYHVRRPVRGIQIKDDTYATIQVRRSDGVSIPLFDAASPTDTGMGLRNSNFLIQSLQEQRAEKQQIILTFGEPYIFFFGEQPRMITVAGVLLNTEDFNWRNEWWANYDKYLRGTQCVRQKTRVYLSWDDIVVEGYIIQAGASEEAGSPNLVQFTFQMFLTNYQTISTVGDINAHWEGKDIKLDPSTIDLPGTGGTSSTALVRSQNQASEQLNAGQGQSSLLEFLRNGQLNDLSQRLVNVQGQVVDFLSIAGQFVSGRNIRVPRGFEGAAAFDQQVQLAVDSIPGAAAVINGSGSRTLTLKSGPMNLVAEFRAALGSKFGDARVGLPLSANTDEFVARVQLDDNGSQKFNNLYLGQLAENLNAADKVKEVYEALGVHVDPPPDLTLMVKNATFGIVSLGGLDTVAADINSLRSTIGSI